MAGVRDRVALVTGSGSAEGIGFAVARTLLGAGARVAITATTGRIHDRLSEMGGAPRNCFATVADLTDPSQVARVLAETESALGPVEILVNNAGMVQSGHDTPGAPLHETGDDAWQHGIAINLTSVFLVTRAALPGMRARGYGRIVQMSSVTGPVVGIEGSATYAAAKAGILGMARVLALENGRHGITVNCIGPGWIQTASSSQAEIIAGRHTPAGRPGRPDEVAHAALFLAAEEASYITGQLIAVDGGNTIQEVKVAL